MTPDQAALPPGTRVLGFSRAADRPGLASRVAISICGYDGGSMMNIAKSFVSPWDSRPWRYRVSIVVAGFEPLDILEGVAMSVSQLEEARLLTEPILSLPKSLLSDLLKSRLRI